MVTVQDLSKREEYVKILKWFVTALISVSLFNWKKLSLSIITFF